MVDKPKGETIINEARELLDESQQGSGYNRENAESDIRFARLSEQWPDEIRKLRKEEGRPCLTINRLPTLIRQVVNDSRQAKPGIKVSPVDNNADEDTADVISGLIRSIERNGDGAEVAYDTAIDHAVSGGFGFFRIGIDYVSPDSFSMEARIERVPNQLMVHWDVNSTKYDASDWGYAFVSDWLTEDEFKHRYPKAKPVDFQGDTRGDVADWIDGEQIRIAEYWKREEKKRQIYLLNNGRTIRHDVVIAEGRKLDLGGQVSDDEILVLYQQMMGVEIIKEREATFFDVTRRMISGAEVLSEDPWPGSMIPICPVWGEEVFADGRRHFRSMIRDAKDPQTMFNFWRSASTELVALAPRAPWVGPQGFVPKGHEEKWQTANTRSHAFLEYDPTAGNMPQRQAFAGVPAGVVQEALNAADDIKSVTGMYDAAIGARSNETSGKAIFARQRESDNANFHFIDNLNRAIRYAGRCLLEIIPAVYSERETIRILGEDQREKVIKLTQEDGGGQINPETGERELFNLAIGDYDVDVTAGPSYATQREETREFLTEFVRAAPSLLPIVGDVLLDHFDFQGSDVIAERLRALNQAQQAPQGAPQGPGQPGQAPGGPGIPPQV